MTPTIRTLIPTLTVLLLLAAIAPLAVAQTPAQPASPTQPSPTVILDTRGFWRIHQSFAPPLVAGPEGLKPLLNAPYLNEITPEPPANWFAADFDDSAWIRVPALRAARTPYLSRLCLRGKFAVQDPSQVEILTLSVDFHGGAIVYLNGQELTRQGLAAGDKPALAEPYPNDAFTAAGKLVTGETFGRGLSDKQRQQVRDARTRRIDQLAIPGKLLRKGVNVLAVEIIRAPYDAAVVLAGGKKHDLCWGTCEIRRLQLVAPTSRGLTPNATRPQGLQIWNSDPMQGDFDADYGDPNEPLKPIRLAGTRNGSFSGKVVLGSTEPLTGVKATAADLKGPGGKVIPAAAITIRYATPWGEESTSINYYDNIPAYPRGAGLLSALSDLPPETVPVVIHKPNQYIPPLPAEPEPVGGAVLPVWVTVRVPADAAPGDYAGSLSIQLQGDAPISVPLSLTVADFALPDPADFTTWGEMIQVPDTLALEYDVPLWSDRHWQLIERSMKLIGQTGSRVVYVPLIAETNTGNAQSMIRWIRTGEDTYQYDFSIMDKYLDLATRHMGKPELVILEVWDMYQAVDDDKREGQPSRAIRYLQERGALKSQGPIVTLLDRATGDTENVMLPRLDDKNVVPLLKPLMDQLRQRLKDRGLLDVTLFGTISDKAPTKAEVATLHDIAPGIGWVNHSHHGWRPGGKIYDLETVVYQTRVWNVGFYGGGEKETPGYGWKNPHLFADYERHRNLNDFPATTWRHLAEFNITGGQRGIGRLGADNWAVVRDGKGHRSMTAGLRYPHSSRRNLDLYSSAFAPGKEGAVATQRFEAFREGLQECEARIFIERVLTDEGLTGRLGEELTARCQAALRQRLLYMWRSLGNLQLTGPGWYTLNWRGDLSVAGSISFLGSQWPDRTAELFNLAAEVQKKLTKK